MARGLTRPVERVALPLLRSEPGRSLGWPECPLYPVALRSMLLFGLVWHRQMVRLMFPLSRPRKLEVFQYLRMLRPYIAFFVPVIVIASVQTESASRLLKVLLSAAMFLAMGGIWALLGAILSKHEFVRLLKYKKADNTLVLRFDSSELANRARRMAFNVE